MNDYQAPFAIKTWAEEDRPREKLLSKGKHNLTNAELVAILLGSGSRSESAVGLAQRLLNQLSNNLAELGKLDLMELTKLKGIGTAKAVNIIAALELGKRRHMSQSIERPTIRSSKDAFDAIGTTLMDLKHEEFWILLLSRSNRILKKVQISSGGVAGTVVDARIIFRKAIEHLASSIILVHNHPSENLKPSQADIQITKKIKNGGELLEIKVLDHLIIGGISYYSFADEGKM